MTDVAHGVHGDAAAEEFETDVPARLDRLPWSRWHWLVVVALGAVWILDGLEVTIVGGIGPQLQKVLHFSATQVGALGSIYVAGAVCGSLFFGYLTDRMGRKKLFFVTLGVYLVATAATAFAWNFWSFALFRFLTGSGIGGEYAAINSAIDELIPARVRGWVDLAINGSYWVGAAVGAAITFPLLHLSSADLGWRLVFGTGAILGVIVLITRRLLPESPRWLMTHDRVDEANDIVDDIERTVREDTGVDRLPDVDEDPISIKPRGSMGFIEIFRIMIGQYPRRSVLGFALMMSQAFFYNAIFFTYALVLTTFFHVAADSATLYLIPFALGNFLGPLILGRLFDTVGRRVMIGGTYATAGVLMIVAGYLFERGTLSATTLTVAWSIIFFFASAGASAAYLTVSEVFPLEIRALAIAFFYAISTAFGGITGPLIFGILIGSNSASTLYYGYLAGAALMIGAALIEWWLGVDAEQQSLENIATPVSAQDAGEQRAGTHGPQAGDGGQHDGDARPPAAPRRRVRSAASNWSPRPAYSPLVGDGGADREVARLQAILLEHGSMDRAELGRVASARLWGPGRLGRALAVGVADGRLRRVGRHRYEASPAVRSEQRRHAEV